MKLYMHNLYHKCTHVAMHSTLAYTCILIQITLRIVYSSVFSWAGSKLMNVGINCLQILFICCWLKSCIDRIYTEKLIVFLTSIFVLKLLFWLAITWPLAIQATWCWGRKPGWGSFSNNSVTTRHYTTNFENFSPLHPQGNALLAWIMNLYSCVVNTTFQIPVLRVQRVIGNGQASILQLIKLRIFFTWGYN